MAPVTIACPSTVVVYCSSAPPRRDAPARHGRTSAYVSQSGSVWPFASNPARFTASLASCGQSTPAREVVHGAHLLDPVLCFLSRACIGPYRPPRLTTQSKHILHPPPQSVERPCPPHRPSTSFLLSQGRQANVKSGCCVVRFKWLP